MSGHTSEKSTRKYYSLLELTKSIESVIKKTYTGSYWVKAEIAKLNYYPKSGHCYPDLVEKEKGVVLAQIRATIWAGHFTDINNKFLSVTKEPLSDGMTVLIRTSVSYHPVYGLGLHVNDIEPSFTLGEMAKEKLLSIEKLKKQGIFDSNKQLTPALLMQRIAVISVETSKGYHDFKKIIIENEWGYRFFLMLFPAILQGERAISSITEQLKRIKKAHTHFDAVVIIRGGGGDIGLSSYDNFKLAKAVALFPLPIITGIGHATNETVVELVAFKNKITPTDVGYYLIQKFHNFSVRIDNAQKILLNKSRQISDFEKIKINNFIALLKSNTDTLIHAGRHILTLTAHNFNHSAISFVEKQKPVLFELSSLIQNKPLQLILLQENIIQQIAKQLILSATRKLTSDGLLLNSLNDKLRILEPKNILKRGYSITTFNGNPVLNSKNLTVDDVVETQTYEGRFKSKVQSIEKTNK
ncbi:MAG: exodeoxyribonuclease VII large subunit [Bacteroidetes bacterium]|nr:exodeoxyribonuclease VII large subunit [Bacteroidota bacterium]MBL6943241.1 exodeoxyribonuclease VII large subunit [Bacteroidales bacterium]